MTNNVPSESTATSNGGATSRRRSPRFSILVRRIHLYAGLFLLPWVFLYGITGAMFNHQGLFPEVAIQEVGAEQLKNTELSEFPTADELAEQVIAALRDAAPNAEISLASDHGAEFNNNVILEVQASGETHVVHIDPVRHSARVMGTPNKRNPARLLGDVHNVKLPKDPYQIARRSTAEIMNQAGITSSAPPKPRGWCKLNFLASIDGEPSRITYVLRDGHIDATAYDGSGEMTPRQFFMRMHTSHGQPPHWNARMLWSVLLDIMAIAMVTWGLTGLFMWWQLKRTRFVGGIVMAGSIAFAGTVYFSLLHFYATTKL